jgi:hypothetical protein
VRQQLQVSSLHPHVFVIQLPNAFGMISFECADNGACPPKSTTGPPRSVRGGAYRRRSEFRAGNPVADSLDSAALRSARDCANSRSFRTAMTISEKRIWSAAPSIAAVLMRSWTQELRAIPYVAQRSKFPIDDASPPG